MVRCALHIAKPPSFINVNRRGTPRGCPITRSKNAPTIVRLTTYEKEARREIEKWQRSDASVLMQAIKVRASIKRFMSHLVLGVWKDVAFLKPGSSLG